MGIKLRDYQITALNNFLQKEKGILKIATGTGKTITAIQIANKYYELKKDNFC